jgi:hypothetical protein
MRKKYLKLTDEQKARRVIFSSQLQPGTVLHEVMADDEDKDERIERLLNDKFFNDSPFKYNEIRR